MTEKEVKKTKKRWFRAVKCIMRLFIKPTEFKYLGEKVEDGSIIVSNHVGTGAPLAWELYSGVPLRFWGTFEMNEGLVRLYKYQSKVFYHEKKHWNLFLARLFCLIASPLTYIFYRGLRLIATYQDARFMKTMRESLETLEKKSSLVIFPEDSSEGYLDEMKGFHRGVALLIVTTVKKDMDVKVYPSYFKKGKKVYMVGEPVSAKELVEKYKTYDNICEYLCGRCNELGKME